MDEALRKIMLTSDGAVASLNGTPIHPNSITRGTNTPTSSLASLIDSLGERFSDSKTHRARLLLIKEAQATAIRLRYAPVLDPSKVRGTPEWERTVANDPRSSTVLAVAYGVSTSTVKRIKKHYGMSGKRGRPKKDHGLRAA